MTSNLSLIPKLAVMAAASFLLIGCSKTPPKEPKVAKAAVEAPSEPEAPEMPTTPPPGELVAKLVAAQYERIHDAGGLPVTVTATGKQTVLKPLVRNIHSVECKPTPRSEGGSFECSFLMELSLSEGKTWGEQGGRIGVEWDPMEEEWVDEPVMRERIKQRRAEARAGNSK